MTPTSRVAKRRQRLSSRVPLLGGWMRRRAAEDLAKDGSPQAIAALAEAVVHTGDPDVRAMALDALRNLTDRPAIDAACRVWAESRHPDLARVVLDRTWVASAPAEVQALTALATGQVDRLTAGPPALVEPLVRACADPDPLIAERAREVLGALTGREAQDALCRLVIEQDQPQAEEIALAAGYLPRKEHRRALFFFLTEQWERYDLLDFERRLLANAYAAASGDQRRRLRDKLRAAGRVDFLAIVAGQDLRDRVTAMSSGELDLMVQTLIDGGEWATLWDLLFEVPFAWSVRAINAIVHTDWRPPHAGDLAVYQELATLAAQGLPSHDEQVSQVFPPAILQAQARSPELRRFPPAMLRAQARVPGRINDVAFCPTRPVIAVGTGQRKVVIWNYQRAERERVMGRFGHSIGHVTFTGDGTLVCAERTNRTTTPCAIYTFDRDGRQSRLGRHVGSVTGLVPVGASQVLSTGRDGDVVLWNVAEGGEAARNRCWRSYDWSSTGRPDWARTMCVSPDHRRAALVCENVMLMALPELEDLKLGYNTTRIRQAAFWRDGSVLVAGKSDGDVTTYRLERRMVTRWASWVRRRRQGKEERLVLLQDRGALAHHEPRVTGVEVIHDHGVAITAGRDGNVHFTALEARGSVGQVQAPGDELTSLHTSPDGSFMALGSAQAELSLWDLRVLGLQGIFVRPFAQATTAMLPALEVVAASPGLPERAQHALRYAQCVLRHRARFDVEIGEPPTILAGEFDIEIEG